MILFKDKLKTKLDVGKSGNYDWHVNPSTRPLVDPAPALVGGQARQAVGPGRVHRRPGPDALPCGDSESEDPGCFNDHPFKVKGGKGVDNGKATVRITWPSPATDWDMKVFEDTDGDEHLGGRDQGGRLIRRRHYERRVDAPSPAPSSSPASTSCG